MLDVNARIYWYWWVKKRNPWIQGDFTVDRCHASRVEGTGCEKALL